MFLDHSHFIREDPRPLDGALDFSFQLFRIVGVRMRRHQRQALCGLHLPLDRFRGRAFRNVRGSFVDALAFIDQFAANRATRAGPSWIDSQERP